jgi:hypothetical protein
MNPDPDSTRLRKPAGGETQTQDEKGVFPGALETGALWFNTGSRRTRG